MGILNVTPDSFFDGSMHSELDAAAGRAWQIAAEGADLLDIGGESTRPGAPPVDEAEELRRVVPVIEALRANGYLLPISVDTTKAAVAKAALLAGAQIINDVSAGRRDPPILDVAARLGAAVILMHSRGDPTTMAGLANYDEVLAEVITELQHACRRASEAGIPADHQAIDPGIGFAKTAEQSVSLLARLSALHTLDRPILVGASRKSFLGRIFGQEGEGRRSGSVAVALPAALQGASILRVHDVGETRRALDVFLALEQGRVAL